MRHTVLFFLASLLLAPAAWAQTTGKITGRVTDASGEPLFGVNVFIDGTQQGNSTGIDGEYVIIGVRPGTYTLVARYIGYVTERREGVQVNVDLTTTVDYQLREEVFEGEEIVVTAEADVVRKDLTSSEARVTSETIERLPVQELSQVLEVQAGITDRNGLHIRGGRSSEVVFMVDGVPVTDSYDGSAAVTLENEGIQELQVISGTFNAEYGNAMSGVINIVTKEGNRDRLGGSFEVYSGSYLVAGNDGADVLRGTNADALASRGVQYGDVDPYSYLSFNPTQYYNLKASLEGPILSERLTFFTLGRYFRNDGWIYGARLYNPDGTYGDSTLIPLNTFEKFSWQGNLRYQLTDNMFMNVIGAGNWNESRDGGLFWRWAPDGRGRSQDWGYDAKLKFTHLVSPTTFYTFDAATFYREAQSRLYDDALDARYNGFLLSPPDSVEVLPGVWEPVVTGSGRFARGGTNLGRFNRSTRSYMLKTDVNSQVNKHNYVKAGVIARLDLLDFRSFGLTTGEGGALEIPDENTLGFQQFSGIEPFTISGYIQDKIEFDSFVVNAGLRLDYFDPRSQVPADPSDPNIFNPLKKTNRFRDLDGDGVISETEERQDNQLTVEDREAYWWTDVEPKWQFSPRLGIAYPITAEGVLHFSYGHFLQIPTLNFLFENFGYKVPNRSGTYGPFGNPDLEPQKTIMYEIGMRQGIGDFVFDLTGYYRDVRNWVSVSGLIDTEIPGVTYVVYTNRDYANTRGVTFTANRRFLDGWGFDLSYTFQVVEGSNSNPAEEYFASLGNAQPKIALLPLDWDQRHKVAGSFYVGGDDWGGSILGIFESGFPYTPSFPEAALFGDNVEPEFATNARRMPNGFQVDLSAYKEFSLGGARPRLFLQVYNVLDSRNATAVYGDTGKPDQTLLQFESQSFDPGFYVRPDFFTEPRRFHLGIEVNF